jgi:hypothetical protein
MRVYESEGKGEGEGNGKGGGVGGGRGEGVGGGRGGCKGIDGCVGSVYRSSIARTVKGPGRRLRARVGVVFFSVPCTLQLT